MAAAQQKRKIGGGKKTLIRGKYKPRGKVLTNEKKAILGLEDGGSAETARERGIF